MSWAARTLELWIRIPLEAWIYVHFFCIVLSYVSRGLEMGRSPIQGVLKNI